MKTTGILKKFLNKIRYRMVLFAIQNRLSNIGINISPYYIFQVRQSENSEPPKLKVDNPSAYEVAILGVDDIKSMDVNFSVYSDIPLLDFYKRSDLCVGVKHNQKIISVQFFNLMECNFKPYKFKLKSNEVYAFGLITMESYKGKNIAPYSTYHCFNLLKKFNKDIIYIVNDCFNTASLNVTKKYNARPVVLFLYINIFKKLQWTIVLQNYNCFGNSS
jgi:hypothetical protein